MSGKQCFKESMRVGKDANGDEVLSWCMKSKSDQYAAHCILCGCDISVNLRGRDALIRHSSKQAHVASANSERDKDGKLSVKSSQLSIESCFSRASKESNQEMSFEDKVTYDVF